MEQGIGVHIDKRNFPDDFFISCLCCIPRAWTLFANDRWIRIFEIHDEGLVLIQEFINHDTMSSSAEPISFMGKASAWLDEAVWKDNFDDLVIVAPSPTLSILNNTLSKPVLARTIAEINWPSIEKKKFMPRKEFKFFPFARDKNQ